MELRDRVASKRGLSWGGVPTGRSQEGLRIPNESCQSASVPKAGGGAEAEGGGFYFEVRSLSHREDTLGVPTAVASLAQALEDRGPC